MIICYILQSTVHGLYFGKDWRGDDSWFHSFRHADTYETFEEAQYYGNRLGHPVMVRLLTLTVGDV